MNATDTVFATLAADGVWFARDGAKPRPSNQGPDDFVRGARCAGVAALRVAATLENSPLIHAALDPEAPWATLLIGPGPFAAARGPAELIRATRAATPDAVGRATLAGWTHASLGGWHRAGPAERAAYACAALGGEAAVRAGFAPADHPIVKRIGFAAGARRGPILALMGAIRDPRWFVAPRADGDDAPVKLRAFLGLGGRRSRGGERRALVAAAWGRDAAASGPPPDPADPRRFAETAYRAALAGGADAYAAETAASRLFLEFVRRCWLDVLYPGVGDGMLTPDHFFADAGVAGGGREAAAAYAAHVGAREVGDFR